MEKLNVIRLWARARSGKPGADVKSPRDVFRYRLSLSP